MTAIDPLAAIEEIKRLKARYFRCMDTRDWDGYGRTFARRGVLEVKSLKTAAPGDASLSRCETGAKAIVTWVRGVLEGAITIHHGHMPEIELLSVDHAQGIWAMEDRVIWPERALHGWGHYHEAYVLEDGAWRIARSCLTRLHVQWSPCLPAAGAARPPMLGAPA